MMSSTHAADAAPGPCAAAGVQRYDAVNSVMEFCDGVNWRMIGAPNKIIAACATATGQQIYNFGTDGMEYCKNAGTKAYFNTNCAITTDLCTLPEKGTQRYNTVPNPDIMQYCNGANWVNMTSTPNNPCCPDGFIPVPADALTGANYDFCVSKYHMKATTNAGASVNGYNLADKNNHFPVSRPAHTPWTGLDFNDAEDECDIFNGDYDFHIITNAEWMTIAKSIENNTLNWSGTGVIGAVGAYIPRGHSDGNPNNAIQAPSEPNALLGCDGINNLNCDDPTNPNFRQKRTLVLLNGQTIWDFAGNVNSWVASDLAGSSLSYPRTVCNPLVNPCTLELNANYSMNAMTGKYVTISAPFMYPPNPLPTTNELGFLPANDAVWATGINYGAGLYSQRGFGMITWLGRNFGDPAFSPQTIPYRGGYYAQSNAPSGEKPGGIYSIWIDLNRNTAAPNIGFRCIYRPTY